MSLINGDRARSDRARKKRNKQRIRTRELRAALKAKTAPAGAKAGGKS